MTPEESKKLDKVYFELIGSDREDDVGLIKRVNDVQKRVTIIEIRTKRIYTLALGIAIGIGIGALIFGILSIKDLIKLIK